MPNNETVKPFSQACENNKTAILSLLKNEFSTSKHVLEIGSGSGQHAVFFAQHLPHLQWQTSDLAINHSGINAWIDELALSNLARPITLDLNQPWPMAEIKKPIDSIFTANTLHIVSFPLVEAFFKGVNDNLQTNGTLCVYGPFNYNGKFTSESNANFDLWLKDRNSDSGIRDFEAIVALAKASQLSLVEDHPMPANNRLLVFKKV